MIVVKDLNHIKELEREYKRKNPHFRFKLSQIIFQKQESIQKYFKEKNLNLITIYKNSLEP